jgi:hypothetical protein
MKQIDYLVQAVNHFETYMNLYNYSWGTSKVPPTRLEIVQELIRLMEIAFYKKTQVGCGRLIVDYIPNEQRFEVYIAL